MKPLTVLALQMDLAWHSPGENRKKAEALLAQHPDPVDLIVLPEMFTTGFSMHADSQSESMEGPSLTWMQETARRRNALVGGSLIIQEELDYFNRFVWVSAAGVECEYDKRHLFRLAGEHEVYEQGKSWTWYPIKGWNTVAMICYDLRFPVWSRNRMQEGRLAYDLLCYVANWPSARVHHWETLLKARAIENQAYVVGVNRVGTDAKGLHYSGSTMIIDPGGKVLAHQVETEGVISASLDPIALQQYREKYPFWQDADAFDMYP